MYGTVTRLQFKPEVDGMTVLQARDASLPIIGLVFQYIYRLEATPNVLILVAGFESKAAFQAYVARNEGDASTDSFRRLLDGEPDVNGGDIFLTAPQ
jgi:hypothetical protein